MNNLNPPKKLIVKYECVDASFEVKSHLWIFIIVGGIVVFFMPILLVFVVAYVLVLPFYYIETKKQQKLFQDDIPALIIDGYILCYEGKTIDLSKMDEARFAPDYDIEYTIQIFEKEKIKPVIEIFTGNMQIDREELLKLIKDRISQAQFSFCEDASIMIHPQT